MNEFMFCFFIVILYAVNWLFGKLQDSCEQQLMSCFVSLARTSLESHSEKMEPRSCASFNVFGWKKVSSLMGNWNKLNGIIHKSFERDRNVGQQQSKFRCAMK